MTKNELTEQMALDAGISKKEAKDALDSLTEGISGAIIGKDGKISLVGFGTFSKSHRKARIGRNPRSGEPVDIKAHNVVTFKASKKLNEIV